MRVSRRRAGAVAAALVAALSLGAGCGSGGGSGSSDPAVESEGVAVTSGGSDVIERRTEALPGDLAGTDRQESAEQPPERPEVRTYRAGEAGVVRVRVGRERLGLVSVAAADGWTWKVTEDEPDEIEVSFFRGDEEIEFEIEIERGQVRVEVDRED